MKKADYAQRARSLAPYCTLHNLRGWWNDALVLQQTRGNARRSELMHRAKLVFWKILGQPACNTLSKLFLMLARFYVALDSLVLEVAIFHSGVHKSSIRATTAEQVFTIEQLNNSSILRNLKFRIQTMKPHQIKYPSR